MNHMPPVAMVIVANYITTLLEARILTLKYLRVLRLSRSTMEKYVPHYNKTLLGTTFIYREDYCTNIYIYSITTYFYDFVVYKNRVSWKFARGNYHMF